MLETCLGATASSLPEPDFQAIGVEMKTLPVNHNGKPKESTYVCMVPLTSITNRQWNESVVKRKLSRVLWVPVEADPGIPLPLRRLGDAFIWSPDLDQENRLRKDWEELTEMIGLGELDQISSRHGEILQIRPKAANSKARVKTWTASGEAGETLPRGFYLRPAFTGEILETRS